MIVKHFIFTLIASETLLSVICSPLKFPSEVEEGRSSSAGRWENSKVGDEVRLFHKRKKRKCALLMSLLGGHRLKRGARAQEEGRFLWPGINVYDTDVYINQGYGPGNGANHDIQSQLGQGRLCGSHLGNHLGSLSSHIGSLSSPLASLGSYNPLSSLGSYIPTGSLGSYNPLSSLGSLGSYNPLSSLGSYNPFGSNGLFGGNRPTGSRPPGNRPTPARPTTVRPTTSTPSGGLGSFGSGNPGGSGGSGSQGGDEDYDYSNFESGNTEMDTGARPNKPRPNRPSSVLSSVGQGIRPVFENSEKFLNTHIVKPIRQSIKQISKLF